MSTSRFRYRSKLYKEETSFRDKYYNNTRGNSLSNTR
jgi:hypothetical protein